MRRPASGRLAGDAVDADHHAGCGGGEGGLVQCDLGRRHLGLRGGDLRLARRQRVGFDLGLHRQVVTCGGDLLRGRVDAGLATDRIRVLLGLVVGQLGLFLAALRAARAVGVHLGLVAGNRRGIGLVGGIHGRHGVVVTLLRVADLMLQLCDLRTRQRRLRRLKIRLGGRQ